MIQSDSLADAERFERAGIGYGARSYNVCPIITLRDGSTCDLREQSVEKLNTFLKLTNGTGWVALQVCYEFERREAIARLAAAPVL
jgi:hypothetical protein